MWWVYRLRQQTSYQIAHVYYQKGDTMDALVWLGSYRANRSKHLVRLVTFRVGTVSYRYLTNQRDPWRFPLSEIARVYQRRWDIELAFLLVKQHLKLHFLWWSKTHALLAQVWGVLLIQVLQALRWQIARESPRWRCSTCPSLCWWSTCHSMWRRASIARSQPRSCGTVGGWASSGHRRARRTRRRTSARPTSHRRRGT